jgi:hypothetical protein
MGLSCGLDVNGFVLWIRRKWACLYWRMTLSLYVKYNLQKLLRNNAYFVLFVGGLLQRIFLKPLIISSVSMVF